MKERGFTLLEVLIVVIIIGILAAIAMPQYLSTLERSRAGEAMANIGSIRSSLDRYWYENSTVSGVTLDTLDIGNPNDVTNKLYTYTLPTLDATGARIYTIKAERTAGGSTYEVWWVQSDSDTGAFYKSSNLGGSGLP